MRPDCEPFLPSGVMAESQGVSQQIANGGGLPKDQCDPVLPVPAESPPKQVELPPFGFGRNSKRVNYNISPGRIRAIPASDIASYHFQRHRSEATEYLRACGVDVSGIRVLTYRIRLPAPPSSMGDPTLIRCPQDGCDARYIFDQWVNTIVIYCPCYKTGYYEAIRSATRVFWPKDLFGRVVLARRLPKTSFNVEAGWQGMAGFWIGGTAWGWPFVREEKEANEIAASYRLGNQFDPRQPHGQPAPYETGTTQHVRGPGYSHLQQYPTYLHGGYIAGQGIAALQMQMGQNPWWGSTNPCFPVAQQYVPQPPRSGSLSNYDLVSPAQVYEWNRRIYEWNAGVESNLGTEFREDGHSITWQSSSPSPPAVAQTEFQGVGAVRLSKTPAGGDTLTVRKKRSALGDDTWAPARGEDREKPVDIEPFAWQLEQVTAGLQVETSERAAGVTRIKVAEPLASGDKKAREQEPQTHENLLERNQTTSTEGNRPKLGLRPKERKEGPNTRRGMESTNWRDRKGG